MSYSIGERLKTYRKKYGIEMPEIAKATGISKHKLYKWENGTKPRKQKEIIILTEYLDEMEKKRQTIMDENVGYMTRGATLCLPLDPSKLAVSQVNGRAAGTVTIQNDSSELIVDRIEAPFLGNVDGVVEVTNESMEPTFKKGSRIAIKRLKDPHIINWGDCYFVIDKNGEGNLKRIFKGSKDDVISLVSDNPDYPTFELNLEQIEAILKVKAGILKY